MKTNIVKPEELHVGNDYSLNALIVDANHENADVDIAFSLTKITKVSTLVETEECDPATGQSIRKNKVTTLHSIEMFAHCPYRKQTLLFSHVLYNKETQTYTAEVYWDANLLTPVNRTGRVEFTLQR